MAERFQFSNKVPRNSVDQQALTHYRIQLDKMKILNKAKEQRYRTRISELQHMLRERGTLQLPDPAPEGNLNLYKKDKQIQQLRQQNAKLKSVTNKPDDLLIKKKDSFQAMAQKDEEIARLKKIIHQIQSKYDGKFFNEHKIKRDYQLLLKENAKLKTHIQSIPKNQRTHQIQPHHLHMLKMRQEYQAIKRQNDYLKDQIRNRGTDRNIQVENLGINAQMESLQMDLDDVNKKNRQLTQAIFQMQSQNQNLKDQNTIHRLSFNPQLFRNQDAMSQVSRNQQPLKNSQRKIFDRTKIQDNDQNSIKSQISLNSHKQSQPNGVTGMTEKKRGRYEIFNLEDTYTNRARETVLPQRTQYQQADLNLN